MNYNFEDSFKLLLREAVTEVVREEIGKINMKLQSIAKKEEEQEFLFVQQAASFLNRSVSTIYSLVQKSMLPHYRRNRQLIFKRSELIQWIEAGKSMKGDYNG